MHLQYRSKGERIAPLALVTVAGAERGTLSARDSLGREYARMPASPGATFTVGGALGYHTLTLEDTGEVVDRLTFRVAAETHIADATSDGDAQGAGEFADLLRMLLYTMVQESGEYHWTRYQGKLYYFFICWLRDHVHVMKGMKYFADRLKDGIDLYRESQREDGMIWDNVHRRQPPGHGPNHWATRFAYDDFIRYFDNGLYEFKRIPVENDVEYLFVEGLYYTWKATGDDDWMARALDVAIKALDYSMTSPYRWSEKYQLLKRGHTIDTWDFQNESDCLTEFAGWADPMVVHPEMTRFGVMFGDNTGYAVACDYLAEMLSHAGRDDEAAAFRRRGAGIRERLDALSWNGRFFTHHVPEDEGLERDLGVDETTQVSLSNAYSLNRRIEHEQCTAIIQTYQGIKNALPPGSPGEWYTIYPPFERGYGGHGSKWQYMNASVTPIVAGELAHGAFEHGFEAYGVDILRRLRALGQQHGGKFHSSYTGAFPDPPQRNFVPLPLPGDDVASERPLAGIPFRVGNITVDGVDTWISIGHGEDCMTEVTLPVHAKAASVYLLHTLAAATPEGVGGTITLHYADGSTDTRHIVAGHNVLPWHHWQYLQAPNARKQAPTSVIAWRDWHPNLMNVQLLAYGLDNPHPDLEIDHITLAAVPGDAVWRVAGVTLCDYRVYFPPGPISFGIPNGWSAAAVVYALIEGLAGVVDDGVTYDQVTLAPRWTAADVNAVETVVHYPASDGYVAYRYRHDAAAGTVTLALTGSGETCTCHILLPQGVETVTKVQVNGADVAFKLANVEQSRYVDFALTLPGPYKVVIKLG